MDKEWNLNPLEEQETILHVDYSTREVRVYTSRKAVARRLFKKFGNPSREYVSYGKLWAVEYRLPADNCTALFSKTMLVGKLSTETSGNTEEDED